MVTANVSVRGHTVYEKILLGTTSSRTRNLLEEWLFHRELPAKGLGNQWKNGFQPGITSSWTRNPPEEWSFTGNHQLMYADSGRQDQNARKTLRAITVKINFLKI
jgi:hypothetical protein